MCRLQLQVEVSTLGTSLQSQYVSHPDCDHEPHSVTPVQSKAKSLLLLVNCCCHEHCSALCQELCGSNNAGCNSTLASAVCVRSLPHGSNAHSHMSGRIHAVGPSTSWSARATARCARPCVTSFCTCARPASSSLSTCRPGRPTILAAHQLLGDSVCAWPHHCQGAQCPIAMHFAVEPNEHRVRHHSRVHNHSQVDMAQAPNLGQPASATGATHPGPP